MLGQVVQTVLASSVERATSGLITTIAGTTWYAYQQLQVYTASPLVTAEIPYMHTCMNSTVRCSTHLSPPFWEVIIYSSRLPIFEIRSPSELAVFHGARVAHW
jgi:hypothetical protein